MSNEQVDRLKVIQGEILALVYEATEIVDEVGSSMTYNRAKAYWIPHIVTATHADHDYLGGSMVTMTDTIKELEAEK